MTKSVSGSPGQPAVLDLRLTNHLARDQGDQMDVRGVLYPNKLIKLKPPRYDASCCDRDSLCLSESDPDYSPSDSERLEEEIQEEHDQRIAGRATKEEELSSHNVPGPDGFYPHIYPHL